MLTSLRAFIRREKSYLGLLLCLALLGYQISGLSKMKASPREFAGESPDARVSAEAFQAGFGSPESLEAMVLSKPHLAPWFQVFFLVFTSFFAGGFVLIMIFLFRRDFRARITVSDPSPPASVWSLGMFPKAMILLVTAFLVSNLLISIAQMLFPRLSFNFFMLLHATLIDGLSLVILISVMRQYGGGLRDLGFRIPSGHFLREFAAGVAGYAGAVPVFSLILLILYLVALVFSYSPPIHPLVSILLEEDKGSVVLFGYSALLAMVIGPVLEETFFRGFCFPLFRSVWGRIPGMVLSSLLFALIHENLFAVFPIFCLGMILAYLYDKRKSLVAPVVMHAVHNSVLMAYFILAKELMS